MAEVRNFLEGAKNLARNPLGIIALFIALIYGFATLLLGAAAQKLETDERTPLVWFLALFPVLVLTAFYRLVTKHHGKLYGPTDYKADESFLRTLPADQQAARLDEEIASTEPAAAAGLIQEPVTPSGDAAVAPAEGEPSVGVEAIRSQYVLAETLAIQKLEREHGVRFQKHVSFGEGRATAFDAVAQDGDLFTAIEVKYVRRQFISTLLLREALYRAVVASSFLERRGQKKRLRLILALVVDGGEQTDIDRLQRQTLPMTRDAPLPVELRIFSFDGLKREFGDSTPDPDVQPTPENGGG